MNPFETLVSIAQRSQDVARELPSKKDAQTHWMGLGFWLTEQRFVVPMEQVVEMMKTPRTTHLPGVKPWVSGVANIRGRLMTIVDLAGYFSEASKRSRAQRRVFVVEMGDIYTGFTVCESLGMQHFSRESHSSDTGDVPEKFKAHLQGSYLAAGIYWPVLSLHSIADEIRETSLAI